MWVIDIVAVTSGNVLWNFCVSRKGVTRGSGWVQTACLCLNLALKSLELCRREIPLLFSQFCYDLRMQMLIGY